jgi:hypothetical protein
LEIKKLLKEIVPKSSTNILYRLETYWPLWGEIMNSLKFAERLGDNIMHQKVIKPIETWKIVML